MKRNWRDDQALLEQGGIRIIRTRSWNFSGREEGFSNQHKDWERAMARGLCVSIVGEGERGQVGKDEGYRWVYQRTCCWNSGYVRVCHFVNLQRLERDLAHHAASSGQRETERERDGRNGRRHTESSIDPANMSHSSRQPTAEGWHSPASSRPTVSCCWLAGWPP